MRCNSHTIKFTLWKHMGLVLFFFFFFLSISMELGGLPRSAYNAVRLQCRRPWFNSWVRKIPWRWDKLPTPVFLGFPGGSEGKESACNVGDLGLIPGSRSSPGGGHGTPLHYSCVENPHRQRGLAGYSPWGPRVGHNWASTAHVLVFRNEQ